VDQSAPLPTTETIKAFVIAAHGDLNTVRTMLAAQPNLLHVEHDWGPAGGREDGLGAASHVGNRPIAEFFLAQGVAPSICALAMLGRSDDVGARLKADPSLASARGAHGITVMFHAALSGDIEVAELLKAAGCKEGYNHALHAAIAGKHTTMVAWLLKNGATIADIPDFENKTPLERAQASDQHEVVALLNDFLANQSIAPD
jgi:ankyrin repeat protein